MPRGLGELRTGGEAEFAQDRGGVSFDAVGQFLILAGFQPTLHPYKGAIRQSGLHSCTRLRTGLQDNNRTGDHERT